MNPPEWLSEFPFLQAQWSEIIALSDIYPSVEHLDLSLDWDKFSLTYRQSNITIDWFAKLRQFRKSRLAYLAYHDLFQPLNQHLKVMNKVSDLADLLIQKAHQQAAADMLAKHGRVIDVNGVCVDLMIWALGKLGTRELNYSSDVDLVLLYSQDGMSDGKRSLDASSYFTRLGQKIIKLLDYFTQDGQVYRVDMRLRPFGSAGPLACSVAALQQYLQYEGREWERFAWMRARMVSGQSAIADEVKNKIKSFIYRKHLDYTVFNALAKIKTEIADHLGYADDDLKQGVGGIRAVEFIVQSLQLVFAGRNTLLQGTEISQQIQQLVNANKLSETDGIRLRLAWLWLRKLENISQLVADQPTHKISDNPVVKQVICDSFNCGNWDELQAIIDSHRGEVDGLFNQLFADADNALQLTVQQKVKLHQLTQDVCNKPLPRKRQENIEQLLHNSLQLAPQSVLEDFLVLIKNILTRPNYILMLLKEKNVHQSVLNLMGKHSYFVSVLQSYPVLLEQLFEREAFTSFNIEGLTSCWHSRAPTEVEDWMEALRYFKLEHQFNLMLAWSEEQINDQQKKCQMTVLAVFVLSEVVRYSYQEIIKKMGKIDLSSRDLIVIAYGSAAMKQMRVESDLDLVFVVDRDQLHPDAYLFVQKWVRRIIHHLTVSMYNGKLYQLDMQLRPNGNSGALVTTKKEFVKYQSEQAWIWEHAAMIKSRAIYASNQQTKWHQVLRSKVLQQKRNAKEVDQALLEMANKLAQQKKNKTHHSEFKVLAAVLKNSHRFPQLTMVRDLDTINSELIKLGLLDV